MTWQNGMQQGNSWYGGAPNFPNYPQYGPGFPAGPPPISPQQGWGFPQYGGYQFPPQSAWPYAALPPNIQQSFVPASNQTNEKKDTTPDVSKVNPPLPPDPPPGEPPKKEEKEDDKESTATTDAKKDSNTETNKSTPTKTESPPSVNMNVTPYFDHNQFSMPPPNAYQMYPGNAWFNNDQAFQNQNYQHNMALGHANNSGAEQNSNGPIKFNLPNKKGNLGNNPLQSSNQAEKKETDDNQASISNENFFQQAIMNNVHSINNNNSPNDNTNNNNNNKKKRKRNNNKQQPQAWVKSENLYTTNTTDNNKLNYSQAPESSLVNKNNYPLSSNSAKSSTDSAPKIPSAGGISEDCWPPSLKRYVANCFARCKTELDKDQVEICLKGKLTSSARNETLWTKNWDKEALISVHSVAALNEKKEPFSPSDTKGSKPTKIIEGDPSRGFTIVRTCSGSRSRSRSHSRSVSPFPSEGRRRRDRRSRHSSSGSDEKVFLSLSTRQGRGGQQRGGRGGKKGKGKGGNFKGAENSAFYSKNGPMTLEPEFCTDERLQKRAARFAGMQQSGRGGGGGGGGGGGKGPNQGPQRKKKQQMNISTTINNTFSVDGDNIDWTSMHIMGTCTTLEKQYLRLTSAPDPWTIRTVATLMNALEHVKKQWLKKHDYHYTCNQLKSIRQDLTVQGIRDDFTIQVYETHCRIALEKGDHEEFNQCQSQLKDLYATRGGSNHLEFTAYRLLYYIYTRNTLDITSMLASLSEADKKDPCVSFALKLRAAWSLSNYHQIFKLYQNAPKMTACLIDWFAKREREQAIKVIVKSYRPGNPPTDFVKSTLALSGEEWVAFVDEFKICFTDKTKQFIDSKQTSATMLAS